MKMFKRIKTIYSFPYSPITLLYSFVFPIYSSYQLNRYSDNEVNTMQIKTAKFANSFIANR